MKPAQSTSPLVYSSVGGWVGKVTERRAIRYGSLRWTKAESVMRTYENANMKQGVGFPHLDDWASRHFNPHRVLCEIITWRKQGHINAPGITGLPSRCQQDEVLPLSPFSDRGCSYAIDGVLLICLVDHLTLSAVETQWCGCLELLDYWALCHIKQSGYVTEFILNIQWI